MNEMLASAPKAFASDVNSVFSSDARLLLTSALSHWVIRNSVNWVIDVAFPEDDSRIRQGHAQPNLAVLRRLAFNLLRRGNSAQIGTAAKRKRVGWKTDYFLKVPSQQDAYALVPPDLAAKLHRKWWYNSYVPIIDKRRRRNVYEVKHIRPKKRITPPYSALVAPNPL